MKFFTPSEAADRLGVCKLTILRRIRDGSIQAVKISQRSLRISEEALQEYITKNSTR